MGLNNYCCKRLHPLIITDGNRRWSEQNKKTIEEAYLIGSQVGLEIARRCLALGFRDLTAFVFSSHNLQRPDEQIKAVLDAVKYFIKEITQMPSVALHIFGQAIGDNRLDEINTRRATEPELTVHLAVNYDWQADWGSVLMAVEHRGLAIVSEQPLNFLGSAQVPEVDLVIRTGNHHSLSGLIMPQLAQAEIFFSQTLWPDYTVEEFEAAVEWFYRQKRQMGM